MERKTTEVTVSCFIDVSTPFDRPPGITPDDAWRVRLVCPGCGSPHTLGETDDADVLECERDGTPVLIPAWLRALDDPTVAR
jgi:hypothetical protein